MKKSFLTVVALLGSTISAYAASVVNTSVTYSSSLLVWLFLGFCAMIVVVQLVPSLILFAGMVRGLFSDRTKSVAEKSL